MNLRQAGPHDIQLGSQQGCGVIAAAPAVAWFLEAAGAVVAPPGCVACRAPTASVRERLCPACVRAVPWLRGGCPRCGLPSHRARGCPAAAAAFPQAWAPVAYEGVAQALVGALKFHGALPVADLMAAHMAANLPPRLRAAAHAAPAAEVVAAPATKPAGEAALVPVPALASRRRRRGFDPAAVLAGALGRRLERPVVCCLERRDRSGRQVGASRAARRAPGRLVVGVRGCAPLAALLVDDVHTTGATLDACARALSAQGTVVVAALSYARTL